MVLAGLHDGLALDRLKLGVANDSLLSSQSVQSDERRPMVEITQQKIIIYQNMDYQ